MEIRLGIIAGSGEIPNLVQKEALEKGYACVIAAIKGHAGMSSLAGVERVKWFDLGDVQGVISYFKTNDVVSVIFAGKIDPRVIYQKTPVNLPALHILESSRDKTPTSLIERVIALFEEQGVSVKDPTPFLQSFFCEKGILTHTPPSAEMEPDIVFGWEMAKRIADLDIGQTVIIKDRAIVAVEGMEGTDEAIKRGGHLAGQGITAIKVGRTHQDPRIDLPALGLATVRSLVAAEGSALCFDADRVPFFQKKDAISLADAHGIAIIAK
jgi:DUF1009 family protein